MGIHVIVEPSNSPQPHPTESFVLSTELENCGLNVDILIGRDTLNYSGSQWLHLVGKECDQVKQLADDGGGGGGGVGVVAGVSICDESDDAPSAPIREPSFIFNVFFGVGLQRQAMRVVAEIYMQCVFCANCPLAFNVQYHQPFSFSYVAAIATGAAAQGGPGAAAVGPVEDAEGRKWQAFDASMWNHLKKMRRSAMMHAGETFETERRGRSDAIDGIATGIDRILAIDNAIADNDFSPVLFVPDMQYERFKTLKMFLETSEAFYTHARAMVVFLYMPNSSSSSYPVSSSAGAGNGGDVYETNDDATSEDFSLHRLLCNALVGKNEIFEYCYMYQKEVVSQIPSLQRQSEYAILRNAAIVYMWRILSRKKYWEDGIDPISVHTASSPIEQAILDIVDVSGIKNMYWHVTEDRQELAKMLWRYMYNEKQTAMLTFYMRCQEGSAPHEEVVMRVGHMYEMGFDVEIVVAE